MEVVLAISRGNLHKYISNLVSSGLSWLPIKVHLQERFSECSSTSMAKHKLTELRQSELPMHEYITKFGDMAEHAYSIKSTNSASVILASNFIEGIQNPPVKNKLRSYQIKNLKDIFGHAIQEVQKKKIRALDFGLTPKSETMPNCSINAIGDEGCFKCGSEDHFVKECPLSQPDNKVENGYYMDSKNVHNTGSATDKLMEPLTRLFTDLVAQMKLLTSSGHGSHGSTPIYNGKDRNGQQWMGFHSNHRWLTIDKYHKREEPNQDHHIDHHHKASSRHNGHQWGSSNGAGNKGNFSRRPHTRIQEIESSSECNSECSVMSDLEEHLEEEVAPVPASPKN